MAMMTTFMRLPIRDANEPRATARGGVHVGGSEFSTIVYTGIDHERTRRYEKHHRKGVGFRSTFHPKVLDYRTVDELGPRGLPEKLDLERLPNWLPAMRDAVVTVQKSGGGARQILCANGYEHFLGLPQYYDLMALVLEDGSWEYTRLGGWYLLTLGQHRLYNAVSEAVGGYYGARSCFGGIAVYNASVYLNEHCAYREGAGRRFSDSSGTSESLFEALRRYTVNGERCEHVTLHECMRARNGGRLWIIPGMAIGGEGCMNVTWQGRAQTLCMPGTPSSLPACEPFTPL